MMYARKRHGLIWALLGVLFWASAAFAQAPYFKLKSMKQLRMEGIKRQTLDYSCGAAALSILLSMYFEDAQDEQTILADITARLSPEEMLSRITEGFSMLDLKNSARYLGYDAHGIMLPPEALSALKGPVIILLRIKDIHHFVVLRGVSQGRAFITDPARGHMRLPVYELLTQWKGETLILGRTGFGLPRRHGLDIARGRATAPEREVVRALQNTPPP